MEQNNSTLSVVDYNDDGSLSLYRYLTHEECVQGLRILKNVYDHTTMLWYDSVLTDSALDDARRKIHLAMRILIDQL